MNTVQKKEYAVIVGATGSFGQAIVKKMSDSGLHVVAISRTASALDELREAYPGLTPCVADISNDSSIDAIRATVKGNVRIAVHGPGVAVAGGILAAPTEAVVDAVNIKVGRMLRLARAVNDRLVRHSRLVAIGGHYGLEPTAYAATAGIANAAIINLMRQLSLALGERGITAHVIAPGPADTERLRRVVKNRADLRGVCHETVIDEMLAESSIKEFVTPEQVAWAVGLLLHPEADAMTGSTLMLDAGRRKGLP